MENTNRYLTGMALAAAAIVFGASMLLHGAAKTYRPLEPDITYNMPRPKSNSLFSFLFGLDGRDIQYKEINPFKDKNKAAANGSVRKDLKNAPKIDAKKAADAKKNTAQKTATQDKKKPEVKVNVVEAPHHEGLGGDSANTNNDYQPGNNQYAPGANPADANGGNNAKDAGLSAAQWRALVLGQPTKQNIDKLVEAFNNKEVDAGTLYLIMNDLLQSSNSGSQSMGIYMAQSVPSLKSFSAVADNYDKLDSNNKKSADSYLATYMQGSRLSIMALALQSNDTVVVSRAVQVMVTGLQTAKNGGTTTSDPRSGRGVTVSGTKNNYAQFIPILQNLEKSSDSSVAGLAQSALSQIQSLSNA